MKLLCLEIFFSFTNCVGLFDSTNTNSVFVTNRWYRIFLELRNKQDARCYVVIKLNLIGGRARKGDVKKIQLGACTYTMVTSHCQNSGRYRSLPIAEIFQGSDKQNQLKTSSTCSYAVSHKYPGNGSVVCYLEFYYLNINCGLQGKKRTKIKTKKQKAKPCILEFILVPFFDISCYSDSLGYFRSRQLR